MHCMHRRLCGAPVSPEPAASPLTPAGNARVDKEVYQQLAATGKFNVSCRGAPGRGGGQMSLWWAEPHLCPHNCCWAVPCWLCAAQCDFESGQHATLCPTRMLPTIAGDGGGRGRG